MSARACFASRLAAAVAACAAAASTAGAQVTFTNSNPITILAGGQATPYPSSVTVSGYTGTITAVTVTLTGFTHTYTDDLAVVVTGPVAGQQTILFSGAGISSPTQPGTSVTNLTLTFSDSAAATLPINSNFTTGTYRPGLDEYGLSLPAPAPPMPYDDDFAAFVGQAPDGTYSLYVHDFAAPDGGSIASWSIALSGITPVPEPAVLGVAAAGLGAVLWVRRRFGRPNSSATGR
jgi:subtilisin-like proprotein convertase family protein